MRKDLIAAFHGWLRQNGVSAPNAESLAAFCEEYRKYVTISPSDERDMHHALFSPKAKPPEEEETARAPLPEPSQVALPPKPAETRPFRVATFRGGRRK